MLKWRGVDLEIDRITELLKQKCSEAAAEDYRVVTVEEGVASYSANLVE